MRIYVHLCLSKLCHHKSKISTLTRLHLLHESGPRFRVLTRPQSGGTLENPEESSTGVKIYVFFSFLFTLYHEYIHLNIHIYRERSGKNVEEAVRKSRKRANAVGHICWCKVFRIVVSIALFNYPN